MGIVAILYGLAAYLLLGLALLAVFDLATKRIHNKFAQATSDTQSKLTASGNYISTKLASILLLGAIWLFWPMVFIGTLTGKKEDNDGKKEQGTSEKGSG